jgi:L-aspartate oxidase
VAPEAVEKLITDLQELMSHFASLVRDGAGLREGIAAHQRLAAELDHVSAGARMTRRLAETHALYGVAQAILQSALARTESRGAHFRTDYPIRNDADFQKHSIFGRETQVLFETW